MKLVESYLTRNPCCKAGRTIAVKGLMLHSVGCAQPSAQVFVKAWNRPAYTAACVHAFIDADSGEVYQTLPWNTRGWHGGGPCNNTHIGVELCEPGTIVYPKSGVNFTDRDPGKSKAAVLRTYRSAVELFAALCERFNLDPLRDGVIVSHFEGGKRGIATAHADPEHLWGRYGLTMDAFRRDVQEKLHPKEDNMTGEEIYQALNAYLAGQPVPAWAKEELEKARAAGITDETNPTQLIPRYQAALMALRAARAGGAG